MINTILNEKNLPAEKDVQNNDKECAKTELDRLPRNPTHCPISGCNETIFPSDFLAHCISRHVHTRHLTLREAFENNRLLMIANLMTLTFGRLSSLGCIMYAGKSDEPESAPGKRNLCFENSGLWGAHEEFQHHMPVMIMACKTSWSTLINNRELANKLTNMNDVNNHIYIIWLMTSGHSRPVYGTITLFNNTYTQSRSAIRRIINLNDFPSFDKFLREDTNYLLLTNSDIIELSHKIKKSIHLEIVLHEKPQLDVTNIY